MIGDLVFTKRDWIWYTLGVLLTPLVLARLGLSAAQTLAVAGFASAAGPRSRRTP